METVMTYHAKVIAGGKIVIPAKLRRALGVKEGDTLVVEEQDGALVIRTRWDALRRLQEEMRKLVPADVDMVEELIADRRREAAMEEEESRRYAERRQR
jgi:AbrB family looped-hinge helix DNA binding protein